MIGSASQVGSSFCRNTALPAWPNLPSRGSWRWVLPTPFCRWPSLAAKNCTKASTRALVSAGSPPRTSSPTPFNSLRSIAPLWRNTCLISPPVCSGTGSRVHSSSNWGKWIGGRCATCRRCCASGRGVGCGGYGEYAGLAGPLCHLHFPRQASRTNRHEKAEGHLVLPVRGVCACVDLQAGVILHGQMILIMLVAVVMILSQPALDLAEARARQSTDRYSFVWITALALPAVIVPVVEWAYFGSTAPTPAMWAAYGSSEVWAYPPSSD